MGLILLYFLGALSLSFFMFRPGGGTSFHSHIFHFDEGDTRQ